MGQGTRARQDGDQAPRVPVAVYLTIRHPARLTSTYISILEGFTFQEEAPPVTMPRFPIIELVLTAGGLAFIINHQNTLFPRISSSPPLDTWHFGLTNFCLLVFSSVLSPHSELFLHKHFNIGVASEPYFR